VHVVAISELAPGFEAKSGALASVLGAAPVDLLFRLRAVWPGPLVVGTAANEAGAAALAASVAGAGFAPLVIAPDSWETDEARFVVRSPGFPDAVLLVESRQGERRSTALADVDLVIRGTMGASFVETATTSERKLSVGKAVLTGGLLLSSTVTKTTRQQTDTREGFVHLYAPGRPPVVLRESALTYEGFGTRRLSSRAANFAALAAELRRRCPAAVFDERLLTRAGLQRLLGPALAPDQHFDLAITLLVSVLRRGAAPASR
jgi:hypothetical protein